MKRLHKAFTLVELLVVISIIALLVAILMPALGKVRTQAKVAALKATFHSITMGLEQFQNDFGSYPRSEAERDPRGTETQVFSGKYNMGAHNLVRAMGGNDLLGYSESEVYRVDPLSGETQDFSGNYLERKGPYVPLENMEVVNFKQFESDAAKLNEEYEKVGFKGIGELEGNLNPIFLDNFNRKTPRPILYFKANKRGTLISGDPTVVNPIYNFFDNDYILDADGMVDMDVYTGSESVDLKHFPYFIWDHKTGVGAPADALVSGTARPYNRDSFILWSAGPDGEYGTEDDVTNFERK